MSTFLQSQAAFLLSEIKVNSCSISCGHCIYGFTCGSGNVILLLAVTLSVSWFQWFLPTAHKVWEGIAIPCIVCPSPLTMLLRYLKIYWSQLHKTFSEMYLMVDQTPTENQLHVPLIIFVFFNGFFFTLLWYLKKDWPHRHQICVTDEPYKGPEPIENWLPRIIFRFFNEFFKTFY